MTKGRRAKRKKDTFDERGKWLLLCLVLTFLLLVGSLLVILYKGMKSTPPPISKKTTLKKGLKKIPSQVLKGEVAIIIDDIGYNLNTARELIDMDIPLTFSILPYTPYSKRIASEAKSRGKDILLHLPMEPKNPENDPGEGSLFTTMSVKEIQKRVEGDLESVPFIIGVNNHMGSKFSENGELMKVVLKEIKRRRLFFLDSKTSKRSKGYVLAKEMGINAMERDIFLDNEKDIDQIKEQLLKLVDIAKKNGHAVAIGHPHQETVIAIRDMLPVFRDEGVKIVSFSSLMDKEVASR